LIYCFKFQGIETWLSIYPSGIQIVNSKNDDPESDGIFFFPIKSLVYCGALRLTNNKNNNESKWKFLPLDSAAASESKNLKNPPLYVSIVRGVDPSSRGETIECHVFVVGMKKSAMRLVESSQKAYNTCNESVSAFRNRYGSVPAVFKSSEGFSGPAVVRKHDEKGFFYVIDDSAIDLWQLYETESMSDNRYINNNNNNENDYQRKNVLEKSNSLESVESISSSLKATFVEKEMIENGFIDPYQDAPNLIRVEKTVDPETGQNVYVRWLSSNEPRIIETHRTTTPSPPPPPLIIRESGPTPEPIIVEKIVQRKKPQLIIKEIHVNEPAPPPIKVVEEIITGSSSSLDARNVYNKLLQTPSRHKPRRRQIDPLKLANYTSFNNVHPDYYSHHRSKSRKKYYDYPDNRKLYDKPLNDYYNAENYFNELRSPQQKQKKSYIPFPNGSPIYGNHHQRHHHHQHHRTPEPYRYHEDLNVKKRNESKYSHSVSPQHHYQPQQQYSRQEPKKQYRKIYVVDEDQQEIERRNKKSFRANNYSQQQQQQQQVNSNYIYSSPRIPATKMKVKNGYM
jgi:hypothetical protein